MKKWLNGKTIIITGASSGIGKELTKLFINKNNCNVIGVGRSEDKLIKLKEDLADKSSNFSYYLFDVSKEENWINFSNELKQKQVEPTLLINNAGILPKFDNFSNVSIDDGKMVMDTNFYSAVFGCKYILPIVEAKGGVVNISSSDALLAVAGTSFYSASKSALKGFTQSIQHEYKNKYIACIFPGMTKTDIFREMNISAKENKLINKFCSSVEKISKKIYKAVIRKKRYKVIGWDAKSFSLLSRLMPNKGAGLVNGILKKSNAQIFGTVFDDKK